MENDVLNLAFLEESLPSTYFIEDDYVLRNIIPDELWVMVLQNLSDPEDYWRVCAASSFLQQILSSQRCRILFGSVLPIVCNIVKHKEDVAVFPAIVNLRAVCRTWKNAIDKIFEAGATQWPDLELAKYTPTQAIIENFRKTGVLYETFVFPDSPNLFYFDQHFKATHSFSGANPVVSQSLTIVLNDIAFNLDRFNYFLREYAANVRQFRLKLIPGGTCPHTLAQTLIESLPCFRSLKSLHLKFETWKMFSNDEWNRAFSINEFPRIPSLELLVVINIPSPVLRAILRNNPQIKFLDCRSFETDLGSWLDSSTPAPTLNKLAIRLVDRFVFDQFKNLRINWPLTTLNIKIKTAILLKYVVQEVKKKFGSTLQQLRVSAPKSTDALIMNTFTGYPQLRILCLEMHSYPTIHKLLPLTSTLEELYLTFDDMKGRNLLKNVVVWVLFPKLKRLTYQHRNRDSTENWEMSREKWYRQYGSNEDIRSLRKRGQDILYKIFKGPWDKNMGILSNFNDKNLD